MIPKEAVLPLQRSAVSMLVEFSGFSAALLNPGKYSSLKLGALNPLPAVAVRRQPGWNFQPQPIDAVVFPP